MPELRLRRGSCSSTPTWPGAVLAPGPCCVLQLLVTGIGTIFPLQMSYELWQDLEEESESEGQGRKPEIGNIFLMDRGKGWQQWE